MQAMPQISMALSRSLEVIFDNFQVLAEMVHEDVSLTYATVILKGTYISLFVSRIYC
jgi:hypothetical protein